MPNTMLKLMPTTMLRLKSVQSDSLPIPGFEPWYVCATDPALSVMIDFRSRASVKLSETAHLNEALGHMKHTGVRCAFVVDEKKDAVVGISHDNVLVKDIMQKISDWRVTDIKDIERSTVGDVLEVFNETGVTHL